MAAIFAALPALQTVATVASIAGTAVAAAGTIAAGKNAKAAAAYEAAQMDRAGKEEQASAQREGEEYRRRKNLALSQLQSRSAASGFSATDPTTLNLADEIEKYGTFQEQTAAYGGNSRRIGLEDQAAGRLAEGRAAQSGSQYSAVGTILGGISSMADRYNPRRRAMAESLGYRYG